MSFVLDLQIFVHYTRSIFYNLFINESEKDDLVADLQENWKIAMGIENWAALSSGMSMFIVFL